MATNLSDNTTRHPIIIIKTPKLITVSYPSPVASSKDPVTVPFLSAGKLSLLGWELGAVLFRVGAMSGHGICGYEDDEESQSADSISRRLKELLSELARELKFL
jgi:hypothetical protein